MLAGRRDLIERAELRIGAATTSITPDQPVALDGHRNLRISNRIESPVTATVLAWESRDGDKVLDQAIMVSCDLVGIRDGILNKVREKVKPFGIVAPLWLRSMSLPAR